jgi:hypothetical protein
VPAQPRCSSRCAAAKGNGEAAGPDRQFEILMTYASRETRSERLRSGLLGGKSDRCRDMIASAGTCC